MISRKQLTCSRSLLVLLALAALTAPAVNAEKRPAPWVGKNLSGKPCKNPAYIPGGGPYDYRNQATSVAKGRIALVENAHFTEDVEQLRRGKSGHIMGDIDFTLRVFPNHHRALVSAVNYSLRFNKWPAGHAGMPAECYLQRAMNYTPLDGVPHRLYGYYMQKKKRYKEALAANIQAIGFYPKDPMIRYNTGLILVEMKRYREAMDYARPLYDAGLTLPGLKNKLVAAGHWKPGKKDQKAVEAYLKALTEAKAKQAADTPEQDAATASDENASDEVTLAAEAD